MNEIWERVLANSFSGIHKSKIICSAVRGNAVGRKERQMEAGFTYLVVQEQSGATLWAGRRGRWRQGSHTWWYRSSLEPRCGQEGEADGGRAHTPVPWGLASSLPNQQAYRNETKSMPILPLPSIYGRVQ